MLKIKNLNKKFGSKTAVAGVTFEVKAKEIFALIGPNGSGKTTIIKTIGGLLQPTKGSISVDGFMVTKEPEKAKSAIGYIPDDPYVWPTMTGEEFMHFIGALYWLPMDVRATRIKKLLPIFGLEAMKDDYFEDYSRGNKQKFSILAALLHEPKVLLVDEPIVGLDPDSAITAKKQFSAFAKRGGAVLLVTHTLSVAQEIAHRIGLLKNGRLMAVGTRSQLAKQAKLGPRASLDEIYLALT